MRIAALIIPALLLAPFLFWPQLSLASVTLSGELLSVTPAAPGPRAAATVSITNTTLLPAGTSVRWFIDGVEMTENQDDTSISITTPGTGVETKVEARLSAPNRAEQVSSASIKPVRLDLIVGANSSVPHFYQGRALPSQASEISVQAFLFGDTAGLFRYRWTINGKEEITEVGGANNQIIIRPRLDNEMNVYVEVTDLNGSIVAQGGTVIPLAGAEVHFYESNPLHGLIPHVLTSPYYFLKDEVTLRAEPYYFSGAQSSFDIKWKVDGRSIQSEANPLELSLAKTQETGQALIELDIINKDNYLETDITELLITY